MGQGARRALCGAYNILPCTEADMNVEVTAVNGRTLLLSL